MSQKYCVIVDAISSGKLFAPELKKRGYECIHVKSTPVRPAMLSPGDPKDYIATFTYEGDFDAIVEQLAAYPIRYVLAGAETGVELADRLSETLGLLTNGTELSHARRDKFSMAERLHEVGVPAIPHCRTNDLDELLNWAKKVRQNKWVVKPLKSAASDGVFVCENEDDLKYAFNHLIGYVSGLGTKNDYILAQPYITGKEYIVNTVSQNGQHYVTDMWVCEKKQTTHGGMVYDTMTLIPSKGSAQKLLVDFIPRVLDALGLQHGPAHAEVFLTEYGPVLIEVGARVMGLGLSVAKQRECLSNTQVDLTLDAYIDPDAFKKKTQAPYKMKQQMEYVSLIAKRKDLMINEAAFAKMRHLETVAMVDRRLKLGQTTRRTIDLGSSPAGILLSNANPEKVNADYLAIRELEKTSLYRERTPSHITKQKPRKQHAR